MKKILLVLVILSLCCGCAQNDNSGYSDTVVKFPDDNSVNGYKTEVCSDELPDFVDANDAKAGKFIFKKEQFIGNSNTNVFHRPDCRYAKKIDAEKRVSFTSRDRAVSQGYKPCKICNP